MFVCIHRAPSLPPAPGCRYAELVLDNAVVDHPSKRDFTLMSLVDGQTTIHMAKVCVLRVSRVRVWVGE